ncbi:pyrimidine regulatory protein PyrR [Indibacter alkaliphilus LW1]|uniref:Pyrimidine regulatory protein PyrR n=2 Tax=Indibacter TaxID=647744 RepID=S2DU86_INDAL|nr:pyrimidine regulatory protein PyrR [Indibacter alkaliphilus LW1]
MADKEMKLKIFTANMSFGDEKVVDIPLKWSHVLKRIKVFGDTVYFLCENTERYLNERYLLILDLKTKESKEIDLKNTVESPISDFEILDDRILLLSYVQNRLIAQVKEMATGKVYTVEDVFQPGMVVQEVFGDELTGVFNLLINFRTKDRSKSFLMSSINKEGVLLRNHLFENESKNRENIDMIISNEGPLKFIAGTVGMTNKVGYNGFYGGYLADGSDPFNNIVEINDLDGFFAFEKDGGEKSRKSWEKSRNPSLKGALAAREIIKNDHGYLLYSDHFLPVGNSFYIKDGVYDRNYYRLNPMKNLSIGRKGGMDDSFIDTDTGRTVKVELGDPKIYFSFISSHVVQFDNNGNVLWDYAVPLPKKSTFVPLSYGQIFSGNKDHFIYEFEGKLFYSLISEGDFQEINQEVKILNPQKGDKVLSLRNSDLEVKALNNGSFLLTGRQQIRYVKEDGQAVDENNFFFQELKVTDL